MDAIQRFAAWCVQSTGWWRWYWDLSLVSTAHFGALQLKKEDVLRWTAPLFEAFVAGAWFLYWTEDTLYWVAKPIVHKDPAPGVRRLHNENRAALESDVENLYFWHGVLVPAFVILRPDWITVKHIEIEGNAEVRRVMIERYGQARYLLDSGAKELHRDEWGILYQKEIPDDESLVMVKVVNSTPEPDGSFRDYFLRVDPFLRPLMVDGIFGEPQEITARNAVASTFGKRGEEYELAVQT